MANFTRMSIHDDVMKASPDSDEAKSKLFGALKDRAASEVKNKRLDCALKLYARALEFSPSTEQTAVIHSNLSLVHATMKNGASALSEADAAIGVDANFAKGHFRRGNALVLLKRIPDSHAAFERASELDPQAKLFAKALRNSQKRLDEYVPDLDPEHTASKQQQSASSVSVTTTGGGGTKATAPPAAASSKAAASTNTAPAPAPAPAKKGTTKAELRGYKIVNGKKTSYFHHEMTEEEKRLIGDITPQRIDPATQAAPAQPAVEGMSKWNSKGTFEDRDVLPWAKQVLPALLADRAVPCGGCSIRVTEVKDIDGLCSIAFIQKRKRFLFELNFVVHWQADAADAGDAGANGGGVVSVSKGELKLEQFCHDDEDGDDLVPKYTSKKAAAGRSDEESIKRSVVRGEFFKMVQAQLQEFRRQFFAL